MTHGSFLWSREHFKESLLMFHLNINFGIVVSAQIHQERFRSAQIRGLLTCSKTLIQNLWK